MFEKLERKHLSLLEAYLIKHNDDVIYLMKPVEQLTDNQSQGHFYGYIENAQLMGIFYFSNKSVLLLHCTHKKILGSLQLLKAIKHHKPKFVKGNTEMTTGIYNLLCRAVAEISESKSILMVYDKQDVEISKVEGYSLITGDNQIVKDLLSDMRFFIDVENHFGRPVKAINDIIKDFKHLIVQKNYLLAVIGNEIVAQGMIEDETSKLGILSGIYVAPKHRKKGIGNVLSKELTHMLTIRG
ncbi:MAG TPA: hypothetical protein DCS67_02455, partial [Clostridiales bacterium UBA8960]|nr:hypothetical protein [Clostridiales bacterium UBA8960]